MELKNDFTVHKTMLQKVNKAYCVKISLLCFILTFLPYFLLILCCLNINLKVHFPPTEWKNAFKSTINFQILFFAGQKICIDVFKNEALFSHK